MAYDVSVNCWEIESKNDYGMCCVEYERLKELIKERAKPSTDFVFTRSFEIHIRGSGIGNSYWVLFDGESERISLTHFEHA